MVSVEDAFKYCLQYIPFNLSLSSLNILTPFCKLWWAITYPWPVKCPLLLQSYTWWESIVKHLMLLKLRESSKIENNLFNPASYVVITLYQQFFRVETNKYWWYFCNTGIDLFGYYSCCSVQMTNHILPVLYFLTVTCLCVLRFKLLAISLFSKGSSIDSINCNADRLDL
jgi:hypothetical protein